MSDAQAQGDLRKLQLIYAVLTLGVVAVTAVAFAIAFGMRRAIPVTPEAVRTGLFLTVGAVTGGFAANFLAGTAFGARLNKAGADSVSQTVVSASLLRLGILEGGALLGVTVFLLTGLNGVLKVQPFCWLNLTQAFFFFMFVGRNFPTRERFERLLRQAQPVI